MESPAFPITRLRRLRRSPALRNLVRETAVSANDLIYPIFVEDGLDEKQPIAAMPGVFRIPERALRREVEGMARDGIKAIMMFGVSRRKDATGSDAVRPDGLVSRMVRAAKGATPELLGRQAVMAVKAGADMIAPSAMMDGQVAAIRRALDAADHVDTPVMAYS